MHGTTVTGCGLEAGGGGTKSEVEKLQVYFEGDICVTHTILGVVRIPVLHFQLGENSQIRQWTIKLSKRSELLRVKSGKK